MVKLTEKQQRDLLIGLGAADFVTKGKITAKAYDAVLAIAKAGGRALYSGTRAATPFVGRSALRAAGTIGTIAMKHPVLTAGAIIYVNRDEAAQLLREGYDVVSTSDPFGQATEIMERTRGERVPPPLDPFMRPRGAGAGVKRGKTAFNKAISLGMKAVKKSTKGGKRGKLTNAKKTFATVTKTASKILKKKKVSNRGVTGTAARAMRKVLKGSL
jgi:hypothetical protein